MIKALTIWWEQDEVGELLLNEHGELGFVYAKSWLANSSARAISVSLPLREEVFSRRECRPFFEGLLPEEDQRRKVAAALGVSHNNPFKLLEALGGDVAGALELWGKGQKRPEIKRGSKKALSEQALWELMEELPMRPMLAGRGDLRLSLAGAQSKLPVVYREGQTALSALGEPTTHIIKPPIAGLNYTTENEAFCMKLAEAIGLSVAPVEILLYEGQKALLVTRYDRVSEASGQTKRCHQEDFAQALGFTSDRKYSADGGPLLRDCFGLVRQATTRPAQELLKLLDATLFNMVIGNADAHSKNYSLLYQGSNIVLAPLYDLLSTVLYPELSLKFAMKVAGKSTLEELRARDIERLADEIGFTVPFIRKRVVGLTESVLMKLGGAGDWFTPRQIDPGFLSPQQERIAERAKRLGKIFG